MPSNLQPSSYSAPPLPFLAANQKFLQAGARLQANAFKAAMRYQIETLSFLRRRCEADAKLMDDLAGSGEFNDTFDVVTNFVQNAASEYTAEVSRFASIGSRLASEAAKYARDETRNALGDMAVTTTG